MRAAARVSCRLAILALGASPGAGHAEDLRAALAAAYAANPTLAAARETLRATDEGVAIARADGLPSASASVSETENLVQSQLSLGDAPRALALAGTLSVPVYSGGAVRNGMKAADRRVLAGRADLAGSESGLFAQVVAAYMDVRLGEETLRLNRAEVETLRQTQRATADRFHVGEVTKTDLAQAQARLALAEGSLRSAEANLVQARETYGQLVGHAPAALADPPPLPGLPASVEEAEAHALADNPDLAAARERSRAAAYDTRAAGAARLPKVSLFADAGYSDYLGGLKVLGYPSAAFPQSFTSADVGVRATIPLYQGGRPGAQIRQAEAREGAAQDNEIAAERQVIAQLRSAYASWQAARAIIAYNETAVAAARLGLQGVRAENGVGNRTVLDILNAEQELVSAQVQLATARRNAYVAGFSVLAAMGRAGARDLGLDGGALYDPALHYRQMRRSLGDAPGHQGASAPPQPASTPARTTVDTPPQTGTIEGG